MNYKFLLAILINFLLWTGIIYALAPVITACRMRDTHTPNIWTEPNDTSPVEAWQWETPEKRFYMQFRFDKEKKKIVPHMFYVYK